MPTSRRHGIPGTERLAFVDSCIAIYYVERRNPWHEQVVAAFERSSPEVLCISDLVRMECHVGAHQLGDMQLLERYERLFDGLTLIPMTGAVFDRAAELRARHRIKTPDALHLAAALEYGCEEFWTNDMRFASLSAEIVFRTFK
ncbi:MAG TPA: type II toxin-antitoxin system VapC family toxin [Tepidiformaceae bacterium]|nr:type II toxin-antitoxin system VapC family toxin [Tepidiformaceae bacterium]